MTTPPLNSGLLNTPKFSVVIPSRNGLRYLPFAVESILSQPTDNFELIVSDNHSADDTWNYLLSLSDPRVRVVRPREALSMARHFEYAINEARGEWITVLGDDDALQPYFFELAEKLTAITEYDVVASPRAYFFWPGCEIFYQNAVVEYSAAMGTSTRDSRLGLAKLLFNAGHYFDYPQFYTGTIFRKNFVEDIKKRQAGTLFKSPILDANAVALIFENSPRYTFTNIPLAWVGSSPKSNGFAHSDAAAGSGDSQKRLEDFTKLNAKDNIITSDRFPQSAFINDVDLYFLEAFFQVQSEENSSLRHVSQWKAFSYLVFIKIFRACKAHNDPSVKLAFYGIFEAHGLNLFMLSLFDKTFSFAVLSVNILRKGCRVLRRLVCPSNTATYCASASETDWMIRSHSRTEFPTILDASLVTMKIYKKYLS